MTFRFVPLVTEEHFAAVSSEHVIFGAALGAMEKRFTSFHTTRIVEECFKLRSTLSNFFFYIVWNTFSSFQFI